MKGLKLIAIVLIFVTVIVGVYLAIFSPEHSWSQNHKTDNDLFLYAVLVSVYTTFLIASFVHYEKKKEITKIFGISYRLEHAFRWTALFFGLVIILGVNSGIKEVAFAHLIVTGLAILTGYTTILLDADGNQQKSKSYYLTGIGIGGFLLGFVFNLYSTSWAEVISALPLGYYMFFELKKK